MTPEQKRTFWQSHIDGWRQSGQSQPAYCKQHELKLANFGYWRTRLNKSKRTGKLIPVDVASTTLARLVLPNGIRLEVPVHALIEVLPLLNQAVQEHH